MFIDTKKYQKTHLENDFKNLLKIDQKKIEMVPKWNDVFVVLGALVQAKRLFSINKHVFLLVEFAFALVFAMSWGVFDRSILNPFSLELHWAPP